MPDSRFYRRAGPQSLSQIAGIAGATLSGSCDPRTQIADVATLESATSADLVYVSDQKYLNGFAATKAGACLITRELAQLAPRSCVVLECSDPRGAFAKAAKLFYPQTSPIWSKDEFVSPKASINPTACIAASAVIAANASVGARSKIGPHVVLGPGVAVGDDCTISANVTITHSLIGHRVIIHPGTQIGQDGFGYYAAPNGPQKVPQLGRVIIHDDVEIGANCSIDRGMLEDTIIGRGCKFDNLVQVGHNVVMGQGCIIVSQAGISGSCVLGDGVVLGGQVGVADHVTIGSGAQVAAKSGLMRDVAPKEAVMGYPAKPIRQFWREIAALSRLIKRG